MVRDKRIYFGALESAHGPRLTHIWTVYVETFNIIYVFSGFHHARAELVDMAKPPSSGIALRAQAISSPDHCVNAVVVADNVEVTLFYTYAVDMLEILAQGL